MPADTANSLTTYQHRYVGGQSAQLPSGKIVCVGRNYADHAAELNNPIPKEPLLFIKPATSATTLEQPFAIPQGLGSVHFETEMSILIGQRLTQASEEEAQQAIAGVGLALDLTLRDLQSQLKEKGQPWEKAKAFDGACPLSEFLQPNQIDDLQNVGISLQVNGEYRQRGNSALMLNKVLPLIRYITRFFTLLPGDVVITGTPAGVGKVNSGDQLILALDDKLTIETQVK